MNQPNDAGAIIMALETYFQPRDVFEVRALGAERASWRRPHTETGFFDYDHIGDVPAALAELVSYAGVYVTINPVAPALLARAANRIKPAERNQSTQDEHIVCRRWLPIDCDAVRPAGISSTDDEHDAALSTAREIAAGMATLGWPEPIVIDSGNGGQLLYRIELPAEDDGLVQRCLQAMVGAGCDRVHIDLAVHNAARIWRLPGTWNRKGDDIPERPHRLAKIVHRPNALDVVPPDLLSALVETVATSAEKHYRGGVLPLTTDRPGDDYNDRGDLPALLVRHGWERIGADGGNEHWRRPGKTTGNHSATWNGETFYVFSSNAAPFEANRGYSPFAVYALLDHGGSFSAASQALADDGYGDPLPAHHDDSDVDLSALLAKFVIDEPEEAATELLPANPGMLPAELLTVPGLIGEVMAWTLATAPYPNPVLSFAGALALMSWLTGRKIRMPGGLRTNLYLVAIAESGAGKDWPRKANARIVGDLGAEKAFANEMASSEGIQDALDLTPCLLAQPDEVDTLIRSIAKDDGGGAAGGRWLKLSATLMELYTSADSWYALRRLAIGGNRRRDAEPRTIDQPYLVIYSAATPDAFFGALSEQLISRGFLSRCLILDTPERALGQPATALDATPTPIPARASAWWDWQPTPGNLVNQHPLALAATVTSEAADILAACREDCDREYAAAKGGAKPIWSRCAAQAEQLALLYACSNGMPGQVAVDGEAATWGVSVSSHLARRLLWHMGRHVADGEFAKAQLRLMRFIDDRGGVASVRDCQRYMRSLRPQELDNVIRALISQGCLEGCTMKGRRKAVDGYRRASQ